MSNHDTSNDCEQEYQPLFTQAELEADFTRAVDMYEHMLNERNFEKKSGKDLPDTNDDNRLTRFKAAELNKRFPNRDIE